MSLILLELILYMSRSRGFKFIFVCGYPVVLALFGDGAGLYPRNMLCHPSQKSTEAREHSWFPNFHHRRTYLPLSTVRMPPSSERSATVSPKVKSHELSSVLFFIFKTVIAVLDPLHFRIQNLNQLFNFCKAVNRDYKKDCLESVDQSGEYCLLNNIVSSNP